MKLKQTVSSAFAVSVLACLPGVSFAGDTSHDFAAGEHPAVTVARRGVAADPAANFYPHPANFYWSLTRPMEEGEHPAVVVARRPLNATIDPNAFIPGHPAGGRPRS
jgi:hypothetical protein